jgi:hypothetical protein
MIPSVFRDSRGLEFLDFQNTDDASNIPMPPRILTRVLPRSTAASVFQGLDSLA